MSTGLFRWQKLVSILSFNKVSSNSYNCHDTSRSWIKYNKEQALAKKLTQMHTRKKHATEKKMITEEYKTILNDQHFGKVSAKANA